MELLMVVIVERARRSSEEFDRNQQKSSYGNLPSPVVEQLD
jgi:hypothetical protein